MSYRVSQFYREKVGSPPGFQPFYKDGAVSPFVTGPRNSNFLRTIPTNTKGFFWRDLWLCGKSRSVQGLLESKQKIVGNKAFFRDN